MKIDGSGQRKTQRGVCSRAHGKWAGPIGYKLSSGEGGLLTGLWHSSPAHRYLSAIPAWRRGSSDRSSARQPCPQVLQSHPRVAKGRKSVPLTGLRSGLGPGLARGPCAQVLQRHSGVAKGTSIDPLARGPSTEYSCGRSTWQDCLEPVSNRSLADASAGLRYGIPGERPLGGIMAWRSSHLLALRP